ncbi:alpha/beta hydrolase [Massilia terrae]|uniref:Lysophospholipase n=1 Tax=Massilia terrae TaxID=1811224 RepID=A0ABT2CVQ3_9BURK|nr:lysophospholipase [Massilia terrae]MCS0658064.1 lysophospholipase [Massilia terrae]
MKSGFAKWLLGMVLCGLAALASAAEFQEQAVTLDTGTGTLFGSLLLPAMQGKVPVALIIAGSGPTDRNGNNRLIPGSNDSLKMLAQTLAGDGVASLRYDKRGIAASAAAMGKESDLRFDMYVNDAAAWVEKLRADPRFGQIVVIGHSEGSLIGMLAAQKTKPAAYVSLAGAGDSAPVVLRKQLAGKLPPALASENERILTSLEHGQSTDAVPPELARLYHQGVQPYLVSWFRYSPAQTVKSLDMPVLIVQGDTDIQVGVDQAQALKAAKPDATLAIIPGMNHVLKMVAADSKMPLASYGDPTLPLAPQLLTTLKDFLVSAHIIAPAR